MINSNKVLTQNVSEINCIIFLSKPAGNKQVEIVQYIRVPSEL